MKIKDLLGFFELYAPSMIQESYDNSGLAIGNPNNEINSGLICLDITEEIIEEAIQDKHDIVISHHPVIFTGLKKITGKSSIERIVLKAIKNDIAILSLHTNLDNVLNGVNGINAEKLGLKNPEILKPKEGLLKKLVTFCPIDKADQVREAIFSSGAGHIGSYDNCSFNLFGTGSFRGDDSTNPYLGEKGSIHFEDEVRIETIYPVYKEKEILRTLFEAHPYEEVAYDLYPLTNAFNKIGAGIIGELPERMDEKNFLELLKKAFKVKVIKHSKFLNKKISKVAFCGGSGSFLINDAKAKAADVFVSGDIKYHQFFDAEDKILIVDIGHYQSEQYTKELIFSIINKKFTNFALRISESITNAIDYYI